jgi:Zn ribbon nucleic-acid-binding protein
MPFDDANLTESGCCPSCGENNIDHLEFLDEDDETVKCLTCGHTYEVGAR